MVKTSIQANKKTIATLVVVVVMIVALGYVSYKSLQTQPSQKITPTEDAQDLLSSPSPKPEGVMRLIPQGERTIYKKGDAITLILFVDSARTSVAGYDLHLEYDASVLSFTSFKDATKMIDVVTRQGNGSLSVMGIKKPAVGDAIFWKDDPVGFLTFTSQGEGDAGIRILHTIGNTTDSNILSEERKDILGEVGEVALFVGNGVSIKEGEYTPIQGGYELVLLEKQLAPEDCFDCTSSVVMGVRTDSGAEERITFTMGGIAGYLPQKAEVGEFSFELEYVDANDAIVTYAKN